MFCWDSNDDLSGMVTGIPMFFFNGIRMGFLI